MAEDPAPEALPPLSRAPTRWPLILLLAPVYLALALMFSTGVRVMGYEAFEIDGPSMYPALRQDERVIVDRHAYAFWLPAQDAASKVLRAPDRGDVVILRSPADGFDIVKRVVAIPGDTVEIRDGSLWLNGAPVARGEASECAAFADAPAGLHYRPGECVSRDETLDGRAYGTMGVLDMMDMAPVTLAENQVFVLGDTRDRSNDSRFFGPVQLAHLKGKVLFAYWAPEAGRIGTWVN